MANADDVIIKCRLDSVINYDTKIYYTYHPNGQLHTKTNSEGTWEYDERGRKVRFEPNNANSYSMQWYYHNETDDLIDYYIESYYNGYNSFTYDYDNNNRLISVNEQVDRMGEFYFSSETYSYDSNGNLIRFATDYTNTNAGRLNGMTKCYDNGHVVSVEEYDIYLPPFGLSHSKQRTEYVYDANWLLVSEKLYNISETDEATLEKEIQYGYDSEGRCISKTNLVSFDGVMAESTKVDSIYNDNSIIVKNYEMSFGEWKELSANEKIFDSNGRIICENNYINKNDDMIKNSYKTWDYDLNGKLLSHKSYVLEGASYKPTSSESWSYDTAGNLTNHVDPSGKSESWTYDTAGNLTNYENSSGESESWTYDPTGNLTSHKHNNRYGLIDLSEEFSYDSDGNLIKKFLEKWLCSNQNGAYISGSRNEYKYDSFQNTIQSDEYSKKVSDDVWEMTKRVKYYYDTSINEAEIFMGDNEKLPVEKHVSKLLYYITYLKIGSYKTTYYYSQPDIELIDGIAYFKDTTEENVKSISYIRTFNNTKWQALYIPFSMSYRDWKDDFEVAYVNSIRQLDRDDDGAIDETIMDVVKIKSGSLIPNTPYLIRAKTTGEKKISVTNAVLYKSEENSIDCRTTIAEYTFTGTYNAIPASTLIANDYYAMGGGALIMTDGSSGLNPYRWYMKIEPRSPMYNVSNAAKTITINVVGEEETTGVEELRVTNDKSPVYDMNGRKVNENNLKPGIYIKNGKKVIIK